MFECADEKADNVLANDFYLIHVTRPQLLVEPANMYSVIAGADDSFLLEQMEWGLFEYGSMGSYGILESCY